MTWFKEWLVIEDDKKPLIPTLVINQSENGEIGLAMLKTT